MNLDALLADLKRAVAPSSRDAITELAQTPEGLAFRRRIDDEQVALRRVWVADLQAAPGKHAGRLARAAKLRLTADKKRVDADQQMREVRDLEQVAMGEIIGAQLGLEEEQAYIRRRLVHDADPRLTRFGANCEAYIMRSRNLFSMVPMQEKYDGTIKWSSNALELDSVAASIRAIQQDIAAMMLKAVTRGDVTAFLTDSLRALSKLLRPLDIEVRGLDADDGFETALADRPLLFEAVPTGSDISPR